MFSILVRVKSVHLQHVHVFAIYTQKVANAGKCFQNYTICPADQFNLLS